jgi:predicted HTH domain antitoxin/antitoxin (DNA-binding transcriptional repressor) of toxin-antitoxin stability system
MEYTQRVPKTDLARKTRQVIREVQRGYTVLVESHGQAEAVIMDIVDYRIVRAFLTYHTRPPQLDPQGIGAARLAEMNDPQQAYDLVLAHYLAGAISLGRAAELLGLSLLDLQFRFQRLDVPLNLGVEDEQAARDEVETARNI